MHFLEKDPRGGTEPAHFDGGNRTCCLTVLFKAAIAGHARLLPYMPSKYRIKGVDISGYYKPIFVLLSPCISISHFIRRDGQPDWTRLLAERGKWSIQRSWCLLILYLQLFAQVLMPFPTRTLLPLATVSHRFHDLILRIVHHRLLAAASLQDHKLILECFHPSARLTTPGLICDYIGTGGLSNGFDGEADLYKGVDRAGRLGKLSDIYSHFRPVGPDEERRPRRQRHPAGDVPGYPNVSNTLTAAAPSNETEAPSQIVSLESHELFSQLCTIANLVKAVPNVGFLLSCVTIGEGVIRIWRDWLAQQSVLPRSKGKYSLGTSSVTSASKTDSFEDWERILWLDIACNVGIRLHVIEREDLGTPILMRLDEDAHVAYSIEFEGRSQNLRKCVTL